MGRVGGLGAAIRALRLGLQQSLELELRGTQQDELGRG